MKRKDVLELGFQKALKSQKSADDLVVVLHGACKNKNHMNYIAKALIDAEYSVYNVEFNSRHYKTIDVANMLIPKVIRAAKYYKTIHFVGHSMGGLIIRLMLSRYIPENLGRVVQIATPNWGSELSSYFKNVWLYKKIYGRCAEDFIPDGDLLKNLDCNINYELGSIAGNISNPIFNLLFKFKPNDCRVLIESTRIPGMKDHIKIKATHNNIVKLHKTAYQVKFFLLNGVFDHNSFE